MICTNCGREGHLAKDCPLAVRCYILSVHQGGERWLCWGAGRPEAEAMYRRSQELRSKALYRVIATIKPRKEAA